MSESTPRHRVHLEPGGHELLVSAGENVLAAALAAGIPLPHSCRAGRCASCKARLLAGEIAYPQDKLPPGIVAAEAARGEVLLCQASPRSDLHVETRVAAGTSMPVSGVVVEQVTPLSIGGKSVRLRLLGAAPLRARPGQFVDVQSATGESERVAIVATGAGTMEIEMHELDPQVLVRMRGPFDAPR
ncbi:MAG TPA: 2Fe-2S iron-sulfur cluster-binding protein [Steroidobacteraceae bacterium]|nr:2Fe-2S iron-sulfur cluster-binding protein [Steroidobacteraceae bacterium]